MVIESAQLPIAPERQEEFEQVALVRAREVLEAAPGSHTVRIARGVEHPSTYVLLVEWDSVEAHMAAMEDPGFLEFRDLMRSFYGGPPTVAHFELLT